MFEDIHRLFDSFIAYRENKEYKFQHAKIKLDYWAEDKASKIENESIKKDYNTIKRELDKVESSKFY